LLFKVNGCGGGGGGGGGGKGQRYINKMKQNKQKCILMS